MWSAYMVYGFHKTQAVESALRVVPDYSKQRGAGSSNPSCRFTHGWQWLVFLVAMVQAKQSA
jgi:hypothetical protein